MQRADVTTRAVAAFVDLLIIVGLVRIPDVIGFLAASGYILIKDGLFDRQSAGKKLVGLRVASPDAAAVSFRESIIRNMPLAAALLLSLIPYAGWVLASAVLAVEALTALGDERGMRIGDLIARSMVVPVMAAGIRPAGLDQQPDFGAPADSGNPRDGD